MIRHSNKLFGQVMADDLHQQQLALAQWQPAEREALLFPRHQWAFDLLQGHRMEVETDQ